MVSVFEIKDLSRDFYPRSWQIALSKSWIMTIIVTSILCLGLWIDYANTNAHFARSGAIVTLLGLFGLYVSILLHRKKDQFYAILEKIDDVRPYGFGFDSIDRKVKHAEWMLTIGGPATLKNGTAGEIKHKCEEIIIQLSTTASGLIRGQFWVVVVGTMVWAYGDLITNKLFHCEGAWTC